MEDITYSVERQFWQMFGTTVRTYTQDRQLVSLAHAKAFKLKEDITFYSDESQSTPLFNIKARRIIDLGATYDITAPNGQRVGSLRRKGLSSTFVRDTWLILDANEQEVGQVVEDSGGLAMLRRYIDYVAFFIPQRFDILLGQQTVGQMQQNRNPFTVKLRCSFSQQARELLGETMLLAVPNVLAIIEARQS